jgi:hypothetical protein
VRGIVARHTRGERERAREEEEKEERGQKREVSIFIAIQSGDKNAIGLINSFFIIGKGSDAIFTDKSPSSISKPPRVVMEEVYGRAIHVKDDAFINSI